jgi:hypothetical protein
VRLRARQDRRDEIRCYRDEAGARVAARLVDALQRALLDRDRGHRALGFDPDVAHQASSSIGVSRLALRRRSEMPHDGAPRAPS